MNEKKKTEQNPCVCQSMQYSYFDALICTATVTKVAGCHQVISVT